LKLQSRLRILFRVLALMPFGGRKKFGNKQIVGQLLAREMLLMHGGGRLLLNYLQAPGSARLWQLSKCLSLLLWRLQRLLQRQHTDHAIGHCLSSLRLSLSS
jgi:hypothetical protein